MLFQNLPIRRKLMTALLSTSMAVIFLTCAAFVLYEFITLHKGMIDGYTTRAKIIAANSAGALAFSNEADAAEVLAALKSDPRIIAACLYDDQGRIFARYPVGVPDALFPPAVGASGYREDCLEIFNPVVQGGRTFGTVFLRSNLSALSDRYKAFAWIAMAITVGSMLVAFLLSSLLQRQISSPILVLAGTARAVTQQGNFSIRARKLGEDELGVLTDAFNRMLDEIQSQQRAVAERTRLLDLVMRNMSEGVVVADPDGKMTYFNPAAERIVGQGISSQGPSKWTEEYGVFREDRTTPYPEKESPLVLAIQGQDASGVVQFLRNAGHPDGIFINVNARPLKNEGGEVMGGLVVIRDTTEERKAQENRTRLAAIVEASADAIVGKGLDGTISSWNRGAEEMYGYRAEEIVGKPFWTLGFPDQTAEFESLLAKIRTGEEIKGFETIRRRKDGSAIPVSLSIFPMRDKDGGLLGASAIERDITERKKAEVELQNRAKRLEENNRDLQDFVFVASHDLQEPLRKIQSFGEFLRAEFEKTLGETGNGYVERMQSAAKRMQILINDLLSLTRVTTKAQPFTQVDLGQVLKDVVSDLEVRIAEKKAKVEVGKMPALEADATQMRQLFQNLIGNGLKFQRAGVEPTIRVESTLLDHGRTCRITVEDNGIGFDNKYAEQIFKVFERLHGKDEYEGTGIGLAVCRKVVERHGGAIRAEGEPGKGSRFTVILPVHH